MRHGLKTTFVSLILALALGLLPQLCAGATNAPAFHPNLRLAFEAAAQDDSLVLMVFHSQSATASTKLLDRTIQSPEFAAQGGALQVVTVDVDLGKDTASEFRVREIPTLLLLTANGKMLSRRSGFLETAELMLWLRVAREQLRSGTWADVAPGSKASVFADHANADRLNTNDIATLILLLGDAEPGERETAATLLAGRREAILPDLLNALTNEYLGVRIGACDTLSRLAPMQAERVDPWRTPAEIVPVVLELQQWWAQTKELPQVGDSRTNAPNLQTVAVYVRDLRSNDPELRTRAMSRLLDLGQEVLPELRNELRRAEKNGDERTQGLLEEVRWAILIPNEIERSAHVRVALARGQGAERQAAAARLGRLGAEAIPALAELASDPDPVVVESAVRALSSIGGEKSVPAMAGLIQAADDNLRMTAAQALGKSRSTAAVPALLPALADVNETVACTSLSALEEIYSGGDYSPRSKNRPAEVEAAITRCFTDPRWRVRAAAAELAGKLRSQPQAAGLRKLLEDSDGFVVRNALEALKQIGAAPDPAQLVTLADTHPGLRGEVLALLAKWSSEDAVKAGTELYMAGNTEGRLALLTSLARAATEQQSLRGEVWIPLLKQAAAEPEPRLRRAAAEAISALPPETAVMMTETLLSDVDFEVRTRGALSVMAIMGGGRISTATSVDPRYALLAALEEEEMSSKKSKTNVVVATPERVAAWRKLLTRPADATNLLVAAAGFVTDGTNANPARLEAALRRAEKKDLELLAQPAAMTSLLPLLSGPPAAPILHIVRDTPALGLQALLNLHRLDNAAKAVLLEPAAFRRTADKASPDEVATALNHLLESDTPGFSLMNGSAGWEPIAEALMEATNSAWKAAAIHALGARRSTAKLPAITAALGDSNAWVRAAAVVSFARLAKDRPTLETHIGPLIADPDRRVARKATVVLLEQEIREAADLTGFESQFEYENIQVWVQSSYGQSSSQRPLATLPSRPAYLEHARKQLAETSIEDAALLGLLLAQHEDFSGLERLTTSTGKQEPQDRGLQAVITTIISLSKDGNHLPYLKTLLSATKDAYELRGILQALRGMTGAEARELRLEVNRRMRESTR